MLKKKAIVPVRMCRTLGFYSKLFLVPKPGKKWRPVIDLSLLNNHLSVPTFKMETAEVIRNAICKGEWVVSIDLTDAYFHIPIHEKFQHLLRFHVAGKSYQFRALPFGIATAPLEFSRVVKEVKLMLQNRGIQVHQYLDDWLLRAPSEEMCLQHSKQLVAFVQELGWVINLKKSELKPTQNFDFLGYRFDLVKEKVSPTGKKWQIWTKAIEQLQNSLTTTPRVLMSFIGALASLEKTVPMYRLHIKAPQRFSSRRIYELRWATRTDSSNGQTTIKAPQRFSSRRIYELRWAIFESWCKENQVDFHQPSLSSIADFLTYLFTEKNLKPTTIAGYRTAIADHLGSDFDIS